MVRYIADEEDLKDIQDVFRQYHKLQGSYNQLIGEVEFLRSLVRSFCEPPVINKLDESKEVPE